MIEVPPKREYATISSVEFVFVSVRTTDAHADYRSIEFHSFCRPGIDRYTPVGYDGAIRCDQVEPSVVPGVGTNAYDRSGRLPGREDYLWRLVVQKLHDLAVAGSDQIS